MNKAQQLKDLIQRNQFIMAPGAFDVLTAKIIEDSGFPAVYMTGYGVNAALFGFPDRGLLTMNEMVQSASRISDAIEIPLIADADTGYGNPLNVKRTVKEYERAGIAAIHIEDQTWPKRCGHMQGKSVISLEEMVAKIKAAVDTRNDMLIIARTDAIATDGFDHALERAARYAEAGADILFIEAPTSIEHMQMIPQQFTSRPLLINMSPLTPAVSAEKLEALGYAIAIYPGACLASIIPALTEDIRVLKETGVQKSPDNIIESFITLNTFLKNDVYSEWEKKYS